MAGRVIPREDDGWAAFAWYNQPMETSPGKVLREYKRYLKLNDFQKHLIVGSMLGDGNLRIVGRNREANFTIDHSEQQREYVLWKYEVMREWVTTPPKVLTRTYHKDAHRVLTSLRFQTISHEEFSLWYKIFYRDGVKIIPENIREILTSPVSLAVWFMDDGNKNHQAVFLNTQQFEKHEQERLMACLRENLGCNVRSINTGFIRESSCTEFALIQNQPESCINLLAAICCPQ